MTTKLALFSSCILTLSLAANPWSLSRLFSATTPYQVKEGISLVIVLVSLLFAGVALAYDTIRDLLRDARCVKKEFLSRMKRVPFEIVVFFLSFCVLLKGLELTGLTQLASEQIVQAFRAGPIVGAITTGFCGVALVNVMNNIPSTLFFEKMWTGGIEQSLTDMHPIYADIFVDCALFASNFGANLTFIGALAGLIWLRILKDYANTSSRTLKLPGGKEFLLLGIIVVPIVTAATSFFIGWYRIVLN